MSKIKIDPMSAVTGAAVSGGIALVAGKAVAPAVIAGATAGLVADAFEDLLTDDDGGGIGDALADLFDF